MSEAAAVGATGGDEGGKAAGDTGMLVRGYRAFELLISVHAKVARSEASRDLRRVVSGVALVLVAISLAGFALILAHAAAVLVVQRRLQWDLAPSIGAVAGADVAVALILLMMARSRLSTPVLAETRAMVKKAAGVLRG